MQHAIKRCMEVMADWPFNKTAQKNTPPSVLIVQKEAEITEAQRGFIAHIKTRWWLKRVGRTRVTLSEVP